MNIKIDTTAKCFQCGSPLIQISSVTTHPEGSLFPQTTSKYRCSNDECQAEKDKEEAKRVKLKEEKDEATRKRLEEKEEEKQKRYEEKLLEAIGKEENAKA